MKQYQAAGRLQRIGLVIAVPLMVFAVHENLRAEPVKITPTVTIEAMPAETENEITLEVQTMTELSELDLLARCVEAESGGQCLLGKRLVVDTILNRVDCPDFPNSIREVIMQPGQFAVVQNGSIDTVVPSEETWEAVYREITGPRIDEQITYFRAGRYSSYGQKAYQLDDHFFSK